jgi:hypothetical protein
LNSFWPCQLPASPGPAAAEAVRGIAFSRLEMKRQVQLKRLSTASLAAKWPLIIRTITDDRLRRVWTILIGLSALAVTVFMVTILIHERIQ